MDLMFIFLICLTLAISFLQSTFANSQDITVDSTPATKKLIRTIPILPLSGGQYQGFFLQGYTFIIQADTLVTSPGASELPSTNLTLQYVAIGRGIQNYTCATASSVPVALGAIATLYDATTLAYADEALLHTLPAIAVYRTMPPGYLDIEGNRFDVLGHHFFDSASTPTFDLCSVHKIFYGTKTADIKAPATANKGPAGTGAVDWLQLTAKAGYDSIGVSLAYRVVTAGGNPLNCTVAGVITVQYAAEYWFYN